MAAFTKFQQFSEDLGKKVHNLSADTLKVMLTNSAPNAATHAVKADITEIAAGNGYSAGGSAITVTSYEQTSGTAKLILADLTFTASGASMATFRYAVLYNDTSTSDSLIGYWDYGAGVTLAAGEQLVVDCDASAGVLTVA